MPIKPELRSKYYGRNWRRLSRRLIERRAGNQCEWCHARNGEPHPVTGGTVRLAVAHFNQTPGDDRPENLLVLCQRCHFALDRDQHVENARETRGEKKDAARPLFAAVSGKATPEPWNRRESQPRRAAREAAPTKINILPLFDH